MTFLKWVAVCMFLLACEVWIKKCGIQFWMKIRSMLCTKMFAVIYRLFYAIFDINFRCTDVRSKLVGHGHILINPFFFAFAKFIVFNIIQWQLLLLCIVFYVLESQQINDSSQIKWTAVSRRRVTPPSLDKMKWEKIMPAVTIGISCKHTNHEPTNIM